MASVQAFRGLRYDLGHVGSLSDVIAPPYDVIDSELQKQLYERHPANVVRLILNRDEPGDVDPDARYQRAATFLKNWRREGVLQEDSQGAIYAYQQIFTHEGVDYVRGGFMARIRLERFGEGKIFPHEETHSAAKVDRLKLTRACRTNLSQVFGLFPDPDNEVRMLLDQATRDATPVEATDHLGIVHRMWAVTDMALVAKLQAIMGPKPIFIADGHHRYETACNFRDELATTQSLSPEHPANFVLMMCVGMNDPGMIVLPTHRLFRGMPEYSTDELSQRLNGLFDVSEGGAGIDAASALWDQIEIEANQGWIGLYAAKSDRWLLAKINAAGEARMAELAASQSAAWRGLGVSILHRLVMDDLLAAPANLPKPMYVHSVEELTSALHAGDTSGRDATGQQGQGGRFPLAALVMPATLDHVRQISEHGERMPAKSTYFYPKLLSGLVFNPLD